MNKQRVLFLCTGNSARSQMAEALLRQYGNEIFESYSAGLKPKGVNPLTVKVMEELGIDISTQTSKDINTYLGKTRFQYLITLCDDADENCPTGLPGINARMHWSFEDPARREGTEEERLAKFREVRDQIEQKIKAWVADQS